ncbi:MAG: FecR family protein [Bacteroidales bacterium]|nr:FecR family protein [Bacteroidales bacterium]
MNEYNDIDHLFKENIDKIDKVPSTFSWSVAKGWKEMQRMQGKSGRKLMIRFLKYAAIVFITIGITVLATYIIENRDPQYVEIQTGKGDKTHVTFADGSQVWLNAQSRLKYPKRINKRNRTIYVEGEAYFELSDQQDEPLTIIADNTITQVKESAFNIKTGRENSQITITVAKGKLDVVDDMGNMPVITTSQGEKTTIIPQYEFLFVEENNDNNYLSWKTGNLDFQDVPLSYVIEKIEDLYQVDIEVSNQKLRYCRFSHSFTNESLDEIMEIISKNLNMNYLKKGQKIIIYGTEC